MAQFRFNFAIGGDGGGDAAPTVEAAEGLQGRGAAAGAGSDAAALVAMRLTDPGKVRRQRWHTAEAEVVASEARRVVVRKYTLDVAALPVDAAAPGGAGLRAVRGGAAVWRAMAGTGSCDECSGEDSKHVLDRDGRGGGGGGAAPADSAAEGDALLPREAVQEVAARSDLIPGVYEGGFKMWECSVDLARHVARQAPELAARIAGPDDAPREAGACWRGLRVLELGCGHGVPGIAALALGARVVHFQDYNLDVLAHVTAPNVALNCAHGLEWSQAHDVLLVAGSWSALSAHGQQHDSENPLRVAWYDLVLAAEVLYDDNSAAEWLGLVRRLLAPRGIALVATKDYYFGVGGGRRVLERLIAREGGLYVREVAHFDDGVSNVRSIMELGKL